MTTHVFKPLTIALLLGIAPLSISTAYAVAAVAGPAGPAGATGARGATGLTGAAGAKGNNGSNGSPGIQGLRGLAGTNGTNGTNGATGARGLTGATGPSGGVKGDKGDQGSVGQTGPAGSLQAGIDIGDMQFWDGSTWVIIPAPTKPLYGPTTGSLEFCNGVPGWNVKSTCPPPPNTTVRSIGDNGPAGGIVFYLTDNTGLHGLEAAPVDQVSSAWGCYGASISGGTAVGTGAANTAAIVAAGCAEADTAAKIADAYAVNGYTDWYLPSKDELNLLYQQKTVVGGFASDGYWSSSQLSSDNAWLQRFNYGFQNSLSKYYTLPVRAVRAF